MEIIKKETQELSSVLENKYIEIQMRLRDLQAEENQLKELIKTEMEKLGLIRLESESGLVIDLYPESIENKFDSKAFKKDNPSLYESYLKASCKKSYLKIWHRVAK